MLIFIIDSLEIRKRNVQHSLRYLGIGYSEFMLLDFGILTDEIQDIMLSYNPGNSKAIAIEVWTIP